MNEGCSVKSLKELNRKTEQACRVTKYLLLRGLRPFRNNRPKIAVVLSSKLLYGTNLVASNYVTSAQIRSLSAVIRKTRSENLNKVIQEILETGIIKGTYYEHLNPEILVRLREVWEAL